MVLLLLPVWSVELFRNIFVGIPDILLQLWQVVIFNLLQLWQIVVVVHILVVNINSKAKSLFETVKFQLSLQPANETVHVIIVEGIVRIVERSQASQYKGFLFVHTAKPFLVVLVFIITLINVFIFVFPFRPKLDFQVHTIEPVFVVFVIIIVFKVGPTI